MSLDWSSKKCDPPLPHDENEARDRERLIWASSAVGLSSITRENVREWLVRVLVWNERFGTDLLGPGELAVIERWIGLETNEDDEPRQRWRLRLTVREIEKAERMANEAMGVMA